MQQFLKRGKEPEQDTKMAADSD